MTDSAVRRAVTALDVSAKAGETAPQRWHVWLSNEGRVYATRIKTNGLAETEFTDTPAQMRDLLIRRGVRL